MQMHCKKWWFGGWFVLHVLYLLGGSTSLLQQALALDALTELGFKDGWLSRAASFLILGQTHRFEMLQTEGHDHCKATTLVKHTVVQHSQHQSWSHCEDLSHKILDRTLLKKRGDALVCLFVCLFLTFAILLTTNLFHFGRNLWAPVIFWILQSRTETHWDTVLGEPIAYTYSGTAYLQPYVFFSRSTGSPGAQMCFQLSAPCIFHAYSWAQSRFQNNEHHQLCSRLTDGFPRLWIISQRWESWASSSLCKHVKICKDYDFAAHDMLK